MCHSVLQFVSLMLFISQHQKVFSTLQRKSEMIDGYELQKEIHQMYFPKISLTFAHKCGLLSFL